MSALTSGPSTTQSSQHVPRRTLIRGAAWTVPAVTLAAAAPAYANSGQAGDTGGENEAEPSPPSCRTLVAAHQGWGVTSGGLNNPDTSRSTGWLVRGTHSDSHITANQQPWFDGTHIRNGRDSNEPDGSFISFANNASTSQEAVVTVIYSFMVSGNVTVAVDGKLKLGYGNSGTDPQRTERQVAQVHLVDGAVSQELTRVAHARRAGSGSLSTYFPTPSTATTYDALLRSDADLVADGFVLHQAQAAGGHRTEVGFSTDAIRLTSTNPSPRSVQVKYTLTLDPRGTGPNAAVVNDDIILNPPSITVCPA